MVSEKKTSCRFFERDTSSVNHGLPRHSQVNWIPKNPFLALKRSYKTFFSKICLLDFTAHFVRMENERRWSSRASLLHFRVPLLPPRTNQAAADVKFPSELSCVHFPCVTCFLVCFLAGCALLCAFSVSGDILSLLSCVHFRDQARGLVFLRIAW